LQKITDLGVKSRTAVEPYRNSTQSFAAIAQSLEVAFILEGSVRKYGNRFRVTIQLIDAKSGNHLWAENYDGILNDTIFVVQSHIAKRIAGSLNAIIKPKEERRIDRIPTTNMEAYDLVIRASYESGLWWRTSDDKHLKTAHDHYNKALGIDPKYVKAWRGKSIVYMQEGKYDSALIYSNRALALDPENWEGYGVKGEIYMFKGDPDLAIENYLMAIKLAPRDRSWWYYYSIGRNYLAKNEAIKAVPYFKKAKEMRSDEQVGTTGYNYLGDCYLNIGDYEKAEEYYNAIIKSGDGCTGINKYSKWLLVQGKFQQALHFTDSVCQACEFKCYGLLFEIYLLLNQFKKAEEYFPHAQNLRRGWGDPYQRLLNSQIGYIYYQLGKTDEAEKFFNEQMVMLHSYLDAKEGPYKDRITYLILSRLNALHGNRQEALNYLVEYAKLGFSDGWHDFILVDPFFKNLRDDPKFKVIVKKAQDEKAALRTQIREAEEQGELDL
jgi:tetratricopeptide (TPR) repeat protein